MGCLKLTYYNQGNALEVNANFFGEALEKNAPSDFFCLKAYTYGFQGQESDDEISGTGNAVSYKYRVHDPRIGRFLSIDPLAPDYPWNSPYAFSENRVMDAVELEGLEAAPLNDENVSINEQEASLIQEARSTYEDDNGLIGVDPLDHMQVRVNRASNLNIPSRVRSNGTQYTHAGFDLFAPVGTPVKSVNEGRVEDIYDNANGGAYGMSITVVHMKNLDGEMQRFYTFYAHLSEASVSVGDHVLPGEVIGKAGQTGNANGQSAINSHLHFEAGLATYTSWRGQMLLVPEQRISPNKVMPTKFYKLGSGNTGASSVFSIREKKYQGPGARMKNGRYLDFSFELRIWPRSTYNNQNNPPNPSFTRTSGCLPCLRVERN
jgi:RHS repeat-associated protein